MLTPFANEPILELRRAAVRVAARRRAGGRRRALPLDVPVLIGSTSRARRRASVDRPGRAGPRRRARRGRPARRGRRRPSRRPRAGSREWRAARPAERAAALVAAAAWMRERRLELAALEVRECAKPWPEADADVCEAIDFLEYYARGGDRARSRPPAAAGPGRAQRAALRPARGRRGDLALELPARDPVRDDRGGAGDRQRGRAQARRAVARDAPRGSSRRCAPAASRRRRSRCSRARATSAPRSCAIPSVATIAFTGSLPVGLEIVRAAAETGERHFKQVVAELGGKNCVIVDADADLDEAVPAIVSSAFAYAGQKCSAASRVLVHEAIADQLLERARRRSPGARRRPGARRSAPTCRR